MGEVSLAPSELRLRPVAEHMERALADLAAGWDSNPVVDAVGHCLRGRGKMVRAAVFLAACRAVGGDPDRLIPAASGIEYGHLASLVHDDLIDSDTVRRNASTVWSRFGRSHAVVAGDWLLFAAFHALARCRDVVPAERIVRALEVLALSGLDTCFGVAFELTLTGDVRVAPETYLRMAAAKTGALLRAAAVSGALLGGAAADQVDAAGRYGEHLGVAFQIVDDLLPYTTDEGILGKPAHSDVRNRRPTLPVLYALQECDQITGDLLRATFATPAPDPAAAGRTHGWLLEVLTGTGALDRARAVADRYHAAAVEALGALPPGQGRDQLETLAAAVLDRDR